LVTLDSTLPASYHADAVVSNEAQGAAAIVGHLLELGHRKILHFSGPASEAWSRDRRDCFAKAIRKAPGVKLDVVELPLTLPRQALIREALVRLAGVTAVFCATDGIAEEVYEIAAELGYRIPADLSVVWYGNVDFGSRLNPPLTTVRHQPYRMGQTAARLVVERIEATTPSPSRLERLPVELVPRLSTGRKRP